MLIGLVIASFAADDDPIVVHLVSELISKLGYEIVSAATAPLAISMLERRRRGSASRSSP